MGETDFGTMGMDMTLSCYNAEGEFEGLPAEQIMHVATHSGTGATVHVITSAKSDINSSRPGRHQIRCHCRHDGRLPGRCSVGLRYDHR